MKKTLALVLVLALLLSSVSALALNYSGNLGNEATFETMREVQENGPAALHELIPSTNYTPHSAMANYPVDCAYVYRSANMYGKNAAVRINTVISVFAEKVFETKDDAFAYLKDLGLIDIIDEAIGSVILVTPSNGKAFAAADQKYYYALQTAIFAQGSSERGSDGLRNQGPMTALDPAYYGGFSFYYVIGIDGGATFLNNYVAIEEDYVSRIGGMLLINGKMDRIREVDAVVPVYLVNASDAIVEKYKSINAVDTYCIEGNKTTYYNRALPLQKVVAVETEDVDAAAIVKDAYYSLFVKAQRAQVLPTGLVSASSPYQGYGDDQAPYSLCARNALFPIGDGVMKTADGIYMYTVVSDELAELCNPDGEYVDTWYEYLPEEVVNGTAPAGSIPLVLANHGGGDDPRQFVDGNGLLVLAGKERLAMVACYHQGMGFGNGLNDATNSKLMDILPVLVQYMLDKYPALDASRVYVTGYSMGAGATIRSIYGDASLFAAAVPMALGKVLVDEEHTKQFADVDIPILFTCSEYDLAFLSVFKTADYVLGPAYYTMVEKFMEYNEMDYAAKVGDLDFDKYPISGWKCDNYTVKVMNGEYANYTWLWNNEDGVPMVGVSFSDSMQHALYPPYAEEIFWNFVKHYSRDLTTGEIVYNPYVD